MNVIRQTECLVVNPVMVNNFTALFNCTPAGRTSDLLIAMNLKISTKLFGAWWSVFGRAQRGPTIGFLLLQRFSVGISVENSLNSISVFWFILVCLLLVS